MVIESQIYFGTPDFNSKLAIIKQHSKINEEDLRYGTQAISGLTRDEFMRVFDAVYDKFESSSRVEEPDSSFPKSHIDYHGVRFHLMIGQGSACWTTLVKHQSPKVIDLSETNDFEEAYQQVL